MSLTYNTQDRYAIAAQEDRCAPRTRISIPSSLRPSGSKGFQTVVNDLSISGFSAMSVNRLHDGTLCWLTLPGLQSMQGKVIWWNNGLVGCAFDNLLSTFVYDSLLARWQTDSVFRTL